MLWKKSFYLYSLPPHGMLRRMTRGFCGVLYLGEHDWDEGCCTRRVDLLRRVRETCVVCDESAVDVNRAEGPAELMGEVECVCVCVFQWPASLPTHPQPHSTPVHALLLHCYAFPASPLYVPASLFTHTLPAVLSCLRVCLEAIWPACFFFHKLHSPSSIYYSLCMCVCVFFYYTSCTSTFIHLSVKM